MKADDLISRLEADALQEVATRHPELSAPERRHCQESQWGPALLPFEFTRNSVIASTSRGASFGAKPGLLPVCGGACNSIFRKLDQTSRSALELINQTPEMVRCDERDAGLAGEAALNLVTGNAGAKA